MDIIVAAALIAVGIVIAAAVYARVTGASWSAAAPAVRRRGGCDAGAGPGVAVAT